MLRISNIILNARFLIIIILLGTLAFMFNNARNAKLTYQLAKILPLDNIVYQDYLEFIDEFGESQNTMVIAVQDDNFYTNYHLKECRHFGEILIILY